VTIVLRVEVASQVDDRPQPNAAPQKAAMPGPNPFQDGSGPDKGISPRTGEASEVTKDPLLISQLKSCGPTIGEVRINRRVQHHTPSGQGWAIWPRSSRSTLA
jgi:hypothetical protein